MAEQDRNRDRLLAEGIAWREADRLDEAREQMLELSRAFPGDGAMAAFLAMALYNVGCHHEATSTLLRLVAVSSTTPNIESYRAAIEYYAGNLDKIEGAG